MTCNTTNQINVDDEFRLSVDCMDENDVYSDPDTVTLLLTDPSGNTDTFIYDGGAGDIEKMAVGKYRYDWTLDEAGIWQYTWKTTGTPTMVEHGEFTVLP